MIIWFLRLIAERGDMCGRWTCKNTMQGVQIVTAYESSNGGHQSTPANCYSGALSPLKSNSEGTEGQHSDARHVSSLCVK
jgi:hypothetical protein